MVKTQKKTTFSKILSKTVVLQPKRAKKQIFKNFVQNSGFAAKTHKKPEFSDFCPNQVKTDNKNKFFRNLAQNRSKRTKRQNFQKSCFLKHLFWWGRDEGVREGCEDDVKDQPLEQPLQEAQPVQGEPAPVAGPLPVRTVTLEPFFWHAMRPLSYCKKKQGLKFLLEGISLSVQNKR